MAIQLSRPTQTVLQGRTVPTIVELIKKPTWFAYFKLAVAILLLASIAGGVVYCLVIGVEAELMASLIIAGPIGLIISVGILFGCSGWTIDRERGRITTWWGLIIPFSRRSHPLGHYHRVRILATSNGKDVHLVGDPRSSPGGKPPDLRLSSWNTKGSDDDAEGIASAVSELTGLTIERESFMS